MAYAQGIRVVRQIRRVVAAQCPSRQTDRQLLQQFLAEEDEAAFAALVQRHGPMVLGVCRNVLHHQQDAEDVFQAAFLVLARKARTIRKQQALSSWLYGVAYRLALKARTRRSRRQDREQSIPDAGSASTMDDLTVRELGLILHAELQRLPEDHRAVLLLSYWEGKTRDEAAEVLGMTSGAFKKRLERARRLLGGRLVRRGVAPSVALLGLLLTESGARGAVSCSLIRNTAEAAVVFATGTPGATSAPAAVAIAEGAIRVMNMTRWTTTILMTLFLGSAATVLGLVSYQALHGQPPPPVFNQGQQENAGQAKPGAAKPDAERIVGIWRIAKGLADGRPMPADLTTLGRLEFTKDGKAILNTVQVLSEGTYKLVGPGKIDVTLRPNEEPGLGIYKFDGDNRLTVCAPTDGRGDKRATAFTGDAGSGQILFSLVRTTAADEKPTPEEIAKFLDPAKQVAEAIARQISVANLKHIGLAVHNYHDQNKTMPLHAIYTKDVKTPLLSWRVALLPYLGEGGLYKEFKFDEPWDSEHNKKLIARMPKVYEIPHGKNGDGKTYYQVITGPDTLFDGGKAMRMTDITDGTSNTLLVVEAREPVIWTKPADLTMPKEKDKLPALGGLFKNGFHVLLCDGAVRMLPPTVPPALFRSFVTPRGGEVIDNE
jgi:RNA polymerase sigma factor (sigma-70 family)